MPVTLAMLAVALLASIGVWVLARSSGATDPVEPMAEERWLIGWLRRWPQCRALARSLDRRLAGGAMLAAALVIVLTTALIVGALFDMVAGDSGLARWDQAVAEWGSRRATTWSTDVLDVVTDLGGTGVLVIVVAVVAGADLTRSRNADVALFLGVVLAGVSVINGRLKWLINRPRPDVEPLVGLSGSSFPSGHSSAAAATWFAVALMVSRRWSPPWRAVAAALATLVTMAVAASRHCSACTGSPTWSPA